MRKLMYLAALISILASCKKDEMQPTDLSRNYFPLETGNYWIYQHFKIDSLGNETPLPLIDSVVVSKKTLIGNITYSTLETFTNNSSKSKTEELVRDSVGYVVNSKGIVKFAANNFTDILGSKTQFYNSDTLYSMTYRMEVPDYKVSVPAGTFDVLNRKENIRMFYYSAEKTNMIQKYMNNYYVHNIGLILDTYGYYLTPFESIERRLIRYNVFINERVK